MDNELKKIIAQALREDKASQDITTNTLIPKQASSKARIIIKENATICGLNILKHVFKTLDPKAKIRILKKDGDIIKRNTTVATIEARTRALLKGERVALNFLSYLSGISTNTQQFVKRAATYKALVMDTRKTTPTLRSLEKYAVRCGGGMNHRSNLNEMIFIKDNHRSVLSKRTNLEAAVNRIRKLSRKRIEIEVDTLRQFEDALNAQPDIILLDNMKPTQIKKAIELRKRSKSRKKIELEASGGISLRNVKTIAKTGVERISIGALTHSSKAINISMEIESK